MGVRQQQMGWGECVFTFSRFSCAQFFFIASKKDEEIAFCFNKSTFEIQVYLCSKKLLRNTKM